MDLRESDLVDPNRHWYYQTKAQAVEVEIRRHGPGGGFLLDIGAGSGFFAKHLLESGAVDAAVCVDPEYRDEDLSRSDKRLRFVRCLPDEPFDAVIMIDVLEHVEDDVQLFIDGISRLRPGGTFIVTVPAFLSLWSSHDEYLHHFRRYRRKDLLAVVARSQTNVHDARYIFGALFPVAFLLRRLRGRRSQAGSDLREVPNWLNALLWQWFRFEHRFLPQRIFGLSVLAVGQRAVD